MSRRIEIELTSDRGDGTWTWRAAGARQPKGDVPADLLYPGAQVGEVVRAEAEFEVDGITITSVLPPKGKRAETERIELIGPARAEPGVITNFVPRGERPAGRDRGPRPGRAEGGPGDGAGRRDRGRPAGGPRPDRGTSGDGERRDRPRPEGRDRPTSDRARPDRSSPDRSASDRPRADRPASERPRSDRPSSSRSGPDGRGERDRATADGRGRQSRSGPEAARTSEPARLKSRRLSPANVHRKAVLDTLSPEDRAVAEQVLRGGIPAVRQAVEEQNARARAEGQPTVRPDALVALAEQLLPRLKTAEWRDRAEAAVQNVNDVALRDLRSVVAGAEAAARDDETRMLGVTLRDALSTRLDAMRIDWVGEITRNLDEGRVVRALRVSGRPPDAGIRFPADQVQRLSETAGGAMTPDVAPDRWLALLEAVLESPVRRLVKPVGLPPEPGPALLQAARQAAGLVPALAGLLGIDIPPPPSAPRRGPAGGRPGGAQRQRPPRRDAPAGAPSAPGQPAETDVGSQLTDAGRTDVVAEPAAGAPPDDAGFAPVAAESDVLADRDDIGGGVAPTAPPTTDDLPSPPLEPGEGLGQDVGQPEQGYQPEQEQAYEPAPEQAYEPAPEQAYEPAPEQAYEAAPEQGYQAEPEQALEPQPEQGYQPEQDQEVPPDAVSGDPGLAVGERSS